MRDPQNFNGKSKIKDILKQFRLAHFERALRDVFGIVDIADLQLLRKEDFEKLGCKILDQRKFKKLVEEIGFKWIED